MGEVIKETLIIESNGIRVKACVIENLPKELMFHKTKKLMPMEDYSERLVPCFTRDERGNRVPTGELVDELNTGITQDAAGSGGFIFDLFSDDSMSALKRIDRYIDDNISDPAFKPKREPYAQVPLDPKSPPKAYHQIIRVKLPLPDSPPAIPIADLVTAAPVKFRRPLTEEQKVAARARMAAARAKKVSKSVQQIPPQA